MPTWELKRDESGRLLAPDGWPVGGLATVNEVVTATGLSRSTIYQMIDTGDLTVRRFGRAVRVPWATVRTVFIGGDDCA